MRARKPCRRWQGKPRLDFFRLIQIQKNSENRRMAVMGKIVWGRFSNQRRHQRNRSNYLRRPLCSALIIASNE